MSSLVLLLVAVDRSPAKDPKKRAAGRSSVPEECPVHSSPCLSQAPAQWSEATLRSRSGALSMGDGRALRPRPMFDSWESEDQRREGACLGPHSQLGQNWSRPSSGLLLPHCIDSQVCS